jgi:hypothetical protein
LSPKQSWASAPAVEEPRSERDDPELSATEKENCLFRKLSARASVSAPAGNDILIGDASF